MIFKQSLHSMMERSAKELLHAVELSSPDYKPRQAEAEAEQTTPANVPENDLTVLGKLLSGSGVVVAATGAAMELLPESAETVSQLTIASGLGAAAIGAAIVGYEKLTQ